MTCRMLVMSHLCDALAKCARSREPPDEPAKQAPQPSAVRGGRGSEARPQARARALQPPVKPAARLFPTKILFTVCGALASMLRTQFRILLHVLVLGESIDL